MASVDAYTSCVRLAGSEANERGNSSEIGALQYGPITFSIFNFTRSEQKSEDQLVEEAPTDLWNRSRWSRGAIW